MSLVERLTVYEIGIQNIKQYIIDNNLKPGDRLPTEIELAELFGVSRISLREAIRALTFLGIINAAPKRGLTVGKINMNRVTEYLGFHFALSNYPKEQLMRARCLIETGALPFVMERMDEDPPLYDRLIQLSLPLEKLENTDQYIQADIIYHHALVECSGADPVLAFSDLLQAFFNTFHEEVAEALRTRRNLHHREVLDALKAHRLEEAQNLLRKHLLFLSSV